jgi:cholesterol transport system auxiliary component
MPILRRGVLALALPSELAACSVLPNRPYQEVQRYALALERPRREPPPKRGPVLLMRSVRAAPGMDARGLRIMGGDGQVDTQFYNEWSAPPVDLVEEALRRWLAGSGLFAAVVSPGSRLRAGMVLEAELLRLQAEPRTGLALAGMAALLLLDDPHDGGQVRILGQFTPEGTAPLPGGARRNDPVPAVEAAAAMRNALAAALADLERQLRGAVPVAVRR